MTTQPTLPGLLLPVPHAPRSVTTADIAELRRFPDVSPEAKTVFAKRFGTAAEQLCDSTLTRLGFEPFPAPEFAPYDRVVRIDDADLRLQIKVRLSAEGGRFAFRVVHGNPRQSPGVRAYPDDAFDIVALVVLHENVVKFTASKAQRQCITLSEVAALRANPFASLEAALRELELAEAPSAGLTAVA